MPEGKIEFSRREILKVRESIAISSSNQDSGWTSGRVVLKEDVLKTLA